MCDTFESADLLLRRMGSSSVNAISRRVVVVVVERVESCGELVNSVGRLLPSWRVDHFSQRGGSYHRET